MSARRRAYVSFSLEARSMLAVWLDKAPEASKDQRDPDGWTTGGADSDYLARRLAELAHASNVELIRLHGAAAEWWSRIESARKSAATKARTAASKEAVLPLLQIPENIEAEGRRIAAERLHTKSRRRA